jgi:16S rRNA processing protein RimM
VSDAAGAPTPEHLVVGHIAKPHGTKGEVFVWPLTDSPVEVFEPAATLLLADADGRLGERPRSLVVETARPFKRGMLVRFEGFADRNAVAALHGRYLLMESERVRPLEEGELFYHQLLGARVELADGSLVGTVREVYETEPAHLLEVTSPEGKQHLIPFLATVVTEVDAAARRLVIDPPAGLLEL